MTVAASRSAQPPFIVLRSSSLSLFSVCLALLAACAVGEEPGGTGIATFGNGSTPGSGSASNGESDTEDEDEDADGGDTEGGSGMTGPSDPSGSESGDMPDADVCGDGVITGNEICEAGDLSGQTCQTQGFDSGTLACSADCLDYDTSGCVTYVCGNGMIEGDQVCDGTNLGGQTCQTQGFDAGTLGCAADCTAYDTSSCVTYVCGNGVIEGNEVCDGGNLGGQTCQTQGFNHGTLGCAANCLSFDTSGCSNLIPGGTCCHVQDTPGCSVAQIQQCVCAFDSFCCNFSWDSLCVQGAINSCNAGC
jgi:hypothetical protein